MAIITLEELDGKYEVRSETSDGGPYRVNGDGITQIRKGGTYRKDKNGFIWESAFSMIGPDKIGMVSTVDPSFADNDLYIKDKKDNLTRGKVVYRGELIARREAGRLVLSGEIKHGIVSTRIWLTRINVTATRAFYADMQPVPVGEALGNLALFKDVPDDWCIIVVNVLSAEKLAGRRSRDVNLAAAAAITAVLNAANREEVAYVFNGDSATLLMSAAILFDVAAALHGARKMAEKSFSLSLRVSLVWAEELGKRRAPVRVAKTEIAPGVYQAALYGEGILFAERLAKDPASVSEHDTENIFSPGALAAKRPDFTGLEARWLPLTSRNGVCLTVLLAARQEKDTARGAQLREVLAEIAKIFGKEDDWRPVSKEQLHLTAGFEHLAGEAGVRAAARGAGGRFLYLAWISLLAALGGFCLKSGLKLGAFDGKTYRTTVARHTPFMTFDNTLHLVMDVTRAQKAALEARLAELRAEGRIFYGLHESPSVFLTSLVFDYARQHHHFADGAGGAQALARLQLEQQRAEKTDTAVTSAA